MAIRIIDQYPGQVGAPDTAYPEGIPRNVTSPGGGDGTPWEEALLKDIQGLMQGLLAQVPAGPVTPSGVPDTVLVSQYIDSMKLITQGLDILTFANAETDTSLRLAPDGLGSLQWLVNVAEQMATVNLNTDLVMKPDGLGGVVFGTVPIAGGGGLKSVQTFEAGGTWTKPAGINLIKVTTVGGGGGGQGTGNSGGSSRVGGGGGAYSSLLIDVSLIPSETVTIGAGGAGGVGAGSTNTGGADGGDSTFGAHTSCAGGAGGAFGGGGGLGGAIPSLGDVKVGGGDGSQNQVGVSFFGGAGSVPFAAGNGRDARGFGGGGGGSFGSGTPHTGGDGADGVIIVEEYS